jgi:hypothetical protein
VTIIYNDVKEKLALGETLSTSDVRNLVAELEKFRSIAGYLADCHAATAETLPKSAGKGAHSRMAMICKNAANALEGDTSGISRTGQDLKPIIERCRVEAAHSLAKQSPAVASTTPGL